MIETDPPYHSINAVKQWRHTKTLYAWCHVTKAEPAVRLKDEPVCGDLL